MKNTLLIEKLQKVYNANINVREENFDMRVFYKENCGTTGCLIGNAILHDPYFEKNGLILINVNGFENHNIKHPSYEDSVDLKAVQKFFKLSEFATTLLFATDISKEDALQLLEMTIILLQNYQKLKLSQLINGLLEFSNDNVEHFYEFLKNNWKFIKDHNLECIEDLVNFIENLENKNDISLFYDEIHKYLPIEDLPEHLCENIIRRANAERLENGYVEIDYNLPTVFIKMSDDSEYFFQEHEASELLDSIPYNIYDDDYLLAIAQGW